MGSVRRAFSGAYNYGGRSASLTAASTRYGDEGVESSSSSPTKNKSYFGGDAGTSPRRSASDAAFWKGKRGAKDWVYDDDNEGPLSREEGIGDSADDEDDWDVEQAAEGRVVQLMFTVPKQRLRVVNADVDGGSLISIDDGERRRPQGDEEEGEKRKGKGKEILR
jgi:hypothetical protein